MLVYARTARRAATCASYWRDWFTSEARIVEVLKPKLKSIETQDSLVHRFEIAVQLLLFVLMYHKQNVVVLLICNKRFGNEH